MKLLYCSKSENSIEIVTAENYPDLKENIILYTIKLIIVSLSNTDSQAIGEAAINPLVEGLLILMAENHAVCRKVWSSSSSSQKVKTYFTGLTIPPPTTEKLKMKPCLVY